MGDGVADRACGGGRLQFRGRVGALVRVGLLRAACRDGCPGGAGSVWALRLARARGAMITAGGPLVVDLRDSARPGTRASVRERVGLSSVGFSRFWVLRSDVDSRSSTPAHSGCRPRARGREGRPDMVSPPLWRGSPLRCRRAVMAEAGIGLLRFGWFRAEDCVSGPAGGSLGCMAPGVESSRSMSAAP